MTEGGKGKDTDSRKASKPPTDRPQKKPGKGKSNDAPIKKGSSSPPPVTSGGIPKMDLSDQHEKACKVKVGDLLPAMQLADLAGKRVEDIQPLRGKKATVVVFWSGGPIELEYLQDIFDVVAESFSTAGVRIVAVNVGGAADVVSKSTEDLAAPDFTAFAMLLDSSGESLGKLVSGEAPSMPRTYVLDGEGKIRWFAIVVSREDRLLLAQTLRFLTRP